MPKISEIRIKEIKGISDQRFTFQFIPNRPNFIVAPNGFGKSSFAIALDSLQQNKITVQKENLHKSSSNSHPSITITLEDGTQFSADSTSNQITDHFSIFVINSQLYSKASTRNTGHFTATQSSISVRPITLINTIPERQEVTYSFSQLKTLFGGCAKLLLNLSQILKQETTINKMQENRTSFDKLLGKRNQRKIIEFMDGIKVLRGTKQQLILSIGNCAPMDQIPEMQQLASLLSDIVPQRLSPVEEYVNALQLLNVYTENLSNFTSIAKYYDYVAAKKYLDETIHSFDTTWKNIVAKRKKSSLILELPPANEISNGERDILCFIAKLFEARRKLVKDKCILVIDEIFDYLDDANLIAVQYFINQFIEEYHQAGKELYPILLTHLDPQYFKAYSFNTKNVHYIGGSIRIHDKYKINKILQMNRSDQDDVSKYFLHYHPNSISLEGTFRSLGVEPAIFNSASFRNVAYEELEKYKSGLTYDIGFVCCGLRLKIEEIIYNRLPPNDQSGFLEKHKTTSKLEFAQSKGVVIPELFYLLGIIYNEAMHLDPQHKKLIPIGLKLKNKIIKKMICEVTQS